MLWVITRERVKQSLDSKESAANNVQVDRAIEGACRSIEGELGRKFHPQLATYAFPRPRGCQLFVDAEVDVDLIEVDEVTVDGVAVEGYILAPIDGPPFTQLEFAARIGGRSSGRPVSIEGLWGYDNVTAPAGALAAALTDSATAVDVTDSSTTGVGSLLTVGTERMAVVERGQLDTGQTLQAALTASIAARIVEVGDGTQVHVGEILLVDEERMLVTDVAGNNVIVRRSWDGSVVAAHDLGTAVFALRRLTVDRGVLGTTAAAHDQADPVLRQVFPGPVVTYAVSLAQSLLLQEVTGQQQAPGGHTWGTTVDMDRARAIAACGRETGFA
jgi:hypothetical protein